MDGIIVPLIKGSKSCDYTFIIPEEYTDLGLSNGLLTKQSGISDTIYTYYGECPTNPEGLVDVIRYTPKQSLWKADMGIYLENPNKFTNNINITFEFPRYYIGGKLKKSYHRIFSTENGEYEENSIISDKKNFKVEVSSTNKNKVGALLYTAFTNKLSDKFVVDLPEDFYKINTQIDPEIKSKAEEINKETSALPNYYRIGKFVNSHIKYNIDYVGKDLIIKEIYDQQVGVCEHYTLLYNAMLNAINIPTLYVSGWAFQNDEISGNKKTITHAWTIAFIDGEWKELDATWGLFEGVPAGHIFKNFNQDTYSYSYIYKEQLDKNSLLFYKEPTIKLVTDENDLKDPFIIPEIEGENDDKKSEVINGEGNEDNNGHNNEHNNKDNNGDLDDKSRFQKFSIILLILSLFNYIL